MEEEKLEQEEDDLEEDISDLEDEMKEDKKPTTKTPKDVKIPEQINETWEGFMQPARLGIANTITGEVIEGFEIGRDEGTIQLGQTILNKLDKIAIASGA